MDYRDTIFALSSGSLPSGVAIIRISGPQVRFVLETISGMVPKPRFAAYRPIRNRKNDLLDKGLVLFFPAPHSFTGEDCAELQVHGGRATVMAILSTLRTLPALREAEAGEFTRRAFENGRMDLTAVEGLSDLIRAETELQRRYALEASEGSLTRRFAEWSGRLLEARALIEAELDFSDEDDIPGSVSDRIWPELSLLSAELDAFLKQGHAGEIIRDGFRVALIGRPNAGKSSLLNALAKRDAAIVSDEAGTTRDIVEVRLDLGGYLVLVQDTAGIRQTGSKVEEEGIRRSLEAARKADLVLCLLAPDDDRSVPLPDDCLDSKILVVATKSDLVEGTRDLGTDLWISTRTGDGLSVLIERIRLAVQESTGNGEIIPLRQRHIVLAEEARSYIDLAVRSVEPLEVRSEYLRSAAQSLGRITGQTDVEDLLGVIFSEFCVGK